MSSSSFLLLGRSHAGAWGLVLQIAIGVMLCLYAGQAMLRMYEHATAADGIDAADVLVIPWMQPAQGKDPGARAVLRTLRGVAGVRSAAAGNQSPYGTSAWSVHAWKAGDGGRRHLVSLYLADEDFIATLGMDEPDGRRFAQAEYQDYTGDQHRLHADPAPAIISAVFAARLFGNAEPLGRSLQLLPGKRLHIVGVLPRVPLPATAHRRDGMALILPVRMTRTSEAHFFIRHAGDAEAVSARVRAALAAAYPDVVVAAPATLVALRAQASSGATRHAWTSLAVCVAWGLSTLGMLGLGGHRWMLDHQQEISLRRAFGATDTQLARRLRGEYLMLAVIACAIGMAAAVLLARLMPAWPLSPPSIGTCAAVVIGTVLVVQLAATWPIRQTRRIPPHLVSRSPSVRL